MNDEQLRSATEPRNAVGNNRRPVPRVAIEGDVVAHPTGGQTARHRQANRLAHIPADVHEFAARKRRRREGGAGVAASRLGQDHHGRLRASDDVR